MGKYKLSTKFTFGKYKGITLKNIIESNPSYVTWCVNNSIIELSMEGYDALYLSQKILSERKYTRSYYEMDRQEDANWGQAMGLDECGT